MAKANKVIKKNKLKPIKMVNLKHKKNQFDTGLFLFKIYYIFPSLAKMNNNTIGIANNITISRLSINK